jgi:hypothetical protein
MVFRKEIRKRNYFSEVYASENYFLKIKFQPLQHSLSAPVSYGLEQHHFQHSVNPLTHLKIHQTLV